MSKSSVDNTPRILSLDVIEDMLDDMRDELAEIEADYRQSQTSEGY